MLDLKIHMVSFKVVNSTPPAFVTFHPEKESPTTQQLNLLRDYIRKYDKPVEDDGSDLC